MANPAWFDEAYYLASKLAQLQDNGETGYTNILQVKTAIEAAGMTVYQHFSQYSLVEGTSPNQYFNTEEYLVAKAAQADMTVDELLLAFQAAGFTNAYDHFVQYGWQENVNPSNAFDVSDYIADKAAESGLTEEEVIAAFAAAGFDPITHYLLYGEDEGIPVTPVSDDEQVDTGAGETHNLTTGPDTITGTSSEDTINALPIDAQGNAATTLSAFDTIDGGAGVDTLNIYSDDGEGEGDLLNGAFPSFASVQNVEIVNIYNAGSSAADLGDASNYEGVTELWQFGLAADVTNLETTTIAGFSGVHAGTSNQLYVSAADEALSATIVLDEVEGSLWSNRVHVNVDGAALEAVNISGTMVVSSESYNPDTAQRLSLDITAGVDVQTVTVNTSLDTDLRVYDNDDSEESVSSVDASASTGDISYDADETVMNITTGSGDDEVYLNYVATDDDETATVTTGAGDDTIYVAADADGNDDFAVEVNAGEGDDAIIINAETTTVDAGAGDDIVYVTTDGDEDYRALTDGDSLDGGDGIDTIVVGAETAVLDAGDYVRLQDLTSFEHLRFEAPVGNDGDELDAAELSNFSQIEVTSEETDDLHDTETTYDLSLGDDAWSFVTNIAADQTIVARGDAILYTDGYDADADDTNDDAAALTLNVLSSANAGIFAKSADITVDTTEAEGDVYFYIGDYAPSDMDSATITLVSTTDVDEEVDYVADLTVYSATAGSGFTSLTIDGTGSAEVNNTGGSLTTIDTSDLGGTDVDGDAFSGLTFTGDLDVKETVSVGSGIDYLTISSEAGSTSLTKMDTITGLDLSLNDDGDNFADTSDVFTLNLAEGFTSEIEFVTTTFTSTPSSLGAALNTVSALEDNAVVFQYSGNTYIFVEDEAGASENGNFENTDCVVKLTGLYDLDDLAVMASQSIAVA